MKNKEVFELNSILQNLVTTTMSNEDVFKLIKLKVRITNEVESLQKLLDAIKKEFPIDIKSNKDGSFVDIVETGKKSLGDGKTEEEYRLKGHDILNSYKIQEDKLMEDKSSVVKISISSESLIEINKSNKLTLAKLEFLYTTLDIIEVDK